jgi:anti-sigma B factor antagonist
VLKCRGKVILESSDFLKSEVKSRIPENGRLVLDFTDVSRMDSAGLGSIVSLYLTAKTKNSELELVNFSQPIRKLFAITNLLSIFEKNKQQ